jgi:NAD(P) transhydrogenase subunit beta
VVVLKRSMNPGFAGIDNPLFLNPRTVMLFGDAKDSVEKLIGSVKNL